MANITLTGATSGSTTLAPTDGASATLTLPTGTGTVVTTANPISGQVIQTVTVDYGTSNSTTTTSYVTAVTGSITTKLASSKVYVLATFGCIWVSAQRRHPFNVSKDRAAYAPGYCHHFCF